MTTDNRLLVLRLRRRFAHVTVFALCVAFGIGLASPAIAWTSGQPLSLPFPRLAHVWPSGEYTNAAAARYDYLVLPSSSRNEQLHALNPDIMLLTDLQASNSWEVCVDPNQPVTAEVNLTMARVSARWILTQVGTTLSTAITATATTIPVASLTSGSLALFKVGELVVIENEICRVDAIGTSTLTVKRGVVFPGAPHAAGTRIAATISTYAKSVVMDLTANCPKVTVDPSVGPETWAEWNARAAAARANGPTWDGIYLDRANGSPASTFLNNGARSIDPNRSNISVNDGYAAFDAAWNSGQLSFQQRVRAALGSNKLILGNGSIQNYGVINGSLLESPWRDSTSVTKWREWVVGPAPATFGSYFDWLANARQPNLSTILTYQVDDLPADGLPPNYRKMRLGLTTALMADGFFMYGKGTPALAWFDEYDNAGTGKGYLGQPLGPARLANPELTSPDLIGGDGAFSTSEQFTRWPLFVSGTGYSATKSLDGGAARIDVTAAGGSAARASLQHKSIPLTAGTRYTVTFRARADRARTMLLGLYTTAWSELTDYQTVALDTSWKTIELPYMVSGTDSSAMICFMLGNEVGTAWIDDVKIQAGSRQDLYRRDFEHGVALVNPTDVTETVQLGGSFRKIKGVQVPSVNDGSVVTQVTLPPKDGIILLRTTTPADTTKPTVSITAPATGATVSGSVALAATASDNVGVTRVEFRVDGAMLPIEYLAPYEATWNATGAAPGSHTITATAYDAAGNSSVATVSVTVPTPDATAPSVPRGLVATATSTTSIGLSWTASSDASGIKEYRVYSSGALKATVTGTSATITGLVPSTLYSFYVTAVDNAGNVSAASASASATTLAPPDTTPPSTPTGVVATATSTTSIQVSWTASSDASGIKEYRVYSGGVLRATVTGTTATVTGLVPSTLYSFTVTAVDKAGNVSGSSASASATTLALPDTTPPGATAGVSATALSSTSIKVSWTASTDSSGIKEYRVFMNGALKTTTTATSATITGLSPSATYSFYVQAVDNAGNVSGNSATVSATTLAPPDTTAPSAPTGVVATAASTTSIGLVWTASSDASGIKEYRVYSSGALKATVTGTSATITGLVPSATYSFTVVAVDDAGNVSAASASASATTLLDITPPSGPTGVRVSKLGSNAVRVSWDAQADDAGGSGVKEYRVYDVRTTALVATISHPGTQATISGLSPNTRYGYYVVAVDHAGNVSISSLVAYAKTDRVVVRLKGSTRYATAVLTSQEAYPAGAETVVVATGTNWPDALGGAALAGVLDAPILLTQQNSLPSEVVSEIVRLKAKKAIVLGGTSAVSEAVEAALKRMLGQGNVERIAGTDRYETAAGIAARTIELLGDAYDGTAFVATGANFPDALGASPIAAAKGWPIFLSDPKQGANVGLTAGMRAAGVERTIVLGGAGVVAASVEASLSGLGTTTRIAGADRYETAAAVAAWGVANAGLSWDKVAVATGQTFPDALAGGVLQGASGSVMLLTPTAAIGQSPAAALAANEAAIMVVRYLGAAPEQYF